MDKWACGFRLGFVLVVLATSGVSRAQDQRETLIPGPGYTAEYTGELVSAKSNASGKGSTEGDNSETEKPVPVRFKTTIIGAGEYLVRLEGDEPALVSGYKVEDKWVIGDRTHSTVALLPFGTFPNKEEALKEIQNCDKVSRDDGTPIAARFPQQVMVNDQGFDACLMEEKGADGSSFTRVVGAVPFQTLSLVGKLPGEKMAGRILRLRLVKFEWGNKISIPVNLLKSAPPSSRYSSDVRLTD